ncbi:MAG: hypothetical protein U0559_17595 [Anaerolineae bacterium]
MAAIINDLPKEGLREWTFIRQRRRSRRRLAARSVEPEHYDLFVQLFTLGRAKALRQLTIDQAQLQAGESVLDVGCGTAI